MRKKTGGKGARSEMKSTAVRLKAHYARADVHSRRQQEHYFYPGSGNGNEGNDVLYNDIRFNL